MSASRPQAHIGLRQTICVAKLSNYFGFIKIRIIKFCIFAILKKRIIENYETLHFFDNARCRRRCIVGGR